MSLVNKPYIYLKRANMLLRRQQGLEPTPKGSIHTHHTATPLCFLLSLGRTKVEVSSWNLLLLPMRRTTLRRERFEGSSGKMTEKGTPPGFTASASSRSNGKGDAAQPLRCNCRLVERKKVTGVSGPPGCSAT